MIPRVPTRVALQRAADAAEYHAALDEHHIATLLPTDGLLVGTQTDRGPVWRRPYPGVGGLGRVIARLDHDGTLVKQWQPSACDALGGIPWPVELLRRVVADPVRRLRALAIRDNPATAPLAAEVDWPVARRYLAATLRGELPTVTVDLPCCVVAFDAWAGLAVGPPEPPAGWRPPDPELTLHPPGTDYGVGRPEEVTRYARP